MDRLLSPEQAGEILGITADTVRRLAKNRHLTSVKLGGRVRIRPGDLQAFIDSRVVEAVDRTNPTLARIHERRRHRAS